MKSFKLILTGIVLLVISLVGARAYSADTVATYLMEEGNGIVTQSLPGNLFPADLVNGVAWDASTPLPSSNWCLSFDGLDDYVWTTLYTPDWSEISVEAWVYQDTITDNPGIEMSNYAIVDNDWYEGFFFHTWGDAIGVFIGRTPLYATTNIQPNTWYHVAFTWEGSKPGNNLKIYVNGQLENKRRAYHVRGSLEGIYDVFIGATAYSQSLKMDGKIDEVSIVNGVLTPGQIAFDYQNSLTGTYTPESVAIASANLGAVVEWNSQFGATYQVEWSPDNSNWEVRDSAVIGNGDTMRWNDTAAAGFHQTGSSYYKVTKIKE